MLRAEDQGTDARGQETARLPESFLNQGSDVHLHPLGQNWHQLSRAGLGDAHLQPVSTGRPGSRGPADLTASKHHLEKEKTCPDIRGLRELTPQTPSGCIRTKYSYITARKSSGMAHTRGVQNTLHEPHQRLCGAGRQAQVLRPTTTHTFWQEDV